MAFRAVVVLALVALASAGMDPGYMNFMMGQQQQQQQHQGSGCNQGTGAGCAIPATMDVGSYLQQQSEQQQYQTQQMAEKIKAQFEEVMKQATMKKHRYAMSVMTEFTSMCACANEAFTIYQAMFVENARNLNLTDVNDMNAMNLKPYEANNPKEARELIFAGMIRTMCTSLGEYMAFVQSVENNLQVIEQQNNVTPSG